jgi:hypothetical protein
MKPRYKAKMEQDSSRKGPKPEPGPGASPGTLQTGLRPQQAEDFGLSISYSYSSSLGIFRVILTDYILLFFSSVQRSQSHQLVPASSTLT